MHLLCALGGFAQSYYGKDKYRSFDIYINNVLLQTVKLDDNIGNKCINVDYKFPDALVQSIPTELLTVKFVARHGSRVGGIYYSRLLK